MQSCVHNCLGMQFGMGVKKLHRKLQNDLKDKKISLDKAQDMFDSHKDTFYTFWDYMQDIEYRYADRTPLKTRDGWYLYCDNPNVRSVTNFPMQGAGGAILRRAVKYLQENGIIVISGLHDAVYLLHKIKDTDAIVKQSCELMNQAFKDFYGRDIRMEAKTWKHGEYYVEKKGSKYFAELAEYFLTASEYDTFIENKCIKELM